MKKMKKICAMLVVVALVLMSICMLPIFAEEGNNLILNGDFETLNAAENYPTGWNLAGNTVGKDVQSGNHYISMTGTIMEQVIASGIEEMTTYEFRGYTKKGITGTPKLTISYGRIINDHFQSMIDYSAAEPTIPFMKNVNNVI